MRQGEKSRIKFQVGRFSIPVFPRRKFCRPIYDIYNIEAVRAG